MTANDIERLLSAKHSGDVFVPQCKTGPTHGAKVSILDAWAMMKSWANPLAIGYEIKVSKSDWRSDDKWPLYLPYCNQFYFVCPWGLIPLKELHDGCGLVYVSKTGTRLFTKRKAPRRDIEVADIEQLMRYILMCRSSIIREYEREESGLEYWKAFVEEREDSRAIGRATSRKLVEAYKSNVLEVQVENHRLERKIESLESIEKFCVENGISPGSYMARKQIRNLGDFIREEDERAIRKAADALCGVLGAVHNWQEVE